MKRRLIFPAEVGGSPNGCIIEALSFLSRLVLVSMVAHCACGGFFAFFFFAPPFVSPSFGGAEWPCNPRHPGGASVLLSSGTAAWTLPLA